jgi:hypothetical protein
MARPLTLPVRAILRLPADMPDRIAAVLTDEENATLFIRQAVVAELERRETAAARTPKPPRRKKAAAKRKPARRANV